MRVELTDVSLELAGRVIVENASLHAAEGQFVGLIGPNGSGKTTLLRAVYRALEPVGGQVRVGGEDVWRLSARASAQRTAVVLQNGGSDFEFSVREVVGLGRVPHHGLFDRSTGSDADIVEQTMATAGVTHLAERLVTTLSGGERQRVYLARALAQRTPVVVLDEPTNHLDISAQFDLLNLISGLPVTVFAALHDLNLAAAYCDVIYVLADGHVVAHGAPADVLTPETVRRVYGVEAHCTTNPLTGRMALHFAQAALPAPLSKGET
jgi:iron complex transport system ATP-binding protein